MMKAANQSLVTDLDETEALKLSREMWGSPNQYRTLGSGENEWFTPIEYIEKVRRVLGSIGRGGSVSLNG